MDAWIRPELDPSRADYPGDYVAAREYERSLWDQMQLNERLEAENKRLREVLRVVAEGPSSLARAVLERLEPRP